MFLSSVKEPYEFRVRGVIIIVFIGTLKTFNVYISESPISSYQQCNKVYISRILDAIDITVEFR